MEACPPYCERDDTGNSNVDGMESCSGPNPNHCYLEDMNVYLSCVVKKQCEVYVL